MGRGKGRLHRRCQGPPIHRLVGKTQAPIPRKTSKGPLPFGIALHQHHPAGTLGIPLQAGGVHAAGRKQLGKPVANGIVAQAAQPGHGGAKPGQGTGPIGRGPTQVIGLGTQPVHQSLAKTENLN